MISSDASSTVAPSPSAPHSNSSKRVTFDPALTDSLLSHSFAVSSPLHDSSNNSSRSSDIPLHDMSEKRLADNRAKTYSSLAADEDDEDMPPPLETVPAQHQKHDDHDGCDGGGHGHSHGGGGSGHNHSHSSGSDSRSPSTPSTPRRSPGEKCGGIKKKAKVGETNKAEEANRRARRQLGWASVCCMIFMVCEVIGGIFANSLAVLTDAAHLLSDLAGFLISIFALWLATRPATSRLSFGFHRAEILGALISVLLIWVLTGVLVYEACWRIAHPQDVDGKIMFIVAACGLLVNFAMGMILLQSGHGHSHGLGGGGDHGHSHGGSKKKSKHAHAHSRNAINGSEEEEDNHGHSHAGGGDHGHSHGGEYKGLTDEHDHHGEEEGEHPEEENLNVKAAFIHVLGDALQSVGVMIAAGLIWYNPDWKIADPMCTFMFSILVLFTTTRLIRQSVGVLMEGVPDGIDPDDVEDALLNVPGVIAVHDLHIWSLSVGKPSLSVHLYCRDDAEHVLAAANKMCAKKFNIHHSTIQVERQHDDIDCNDAYQQGHANLDRITQANFADLGIVSNPV